MPSYKLPFTKRTAILSAFLFAALPALLAVTLYFNQDIREKAAEPVVPVVSPTPAYAPGEVIIKFKVDPLSTSVLGISSDGEVKGVQDIRTKLDTQDVAFQEVQAVLPPTSSSPLTQINTQYKIKTLSKVFKGAETPERELTKFKTKFAADIAAGRRKINEEELKKIDLSKTYKLSLEQGTSVEDFVKEYRHMPEVLYAEPNYVVQSFVMPNDTYFNQQWALHNTGQGGGANDADIDAPEAWDITRGSSSVIIAIVDTGLDYTHPDLGGCFGPTCKVVDGYDFKNNDADPRDDNGHGTHVAGIAAGIGNNNLGVSGVCPNCSLMALKFLDAGGGGYIDVAAAAIDYATTHGAKVINNSWGGGGYSQILQDAINRAYASNVVVVAAAGNVSSETPTYPASQLNVVSVAATNNADVKSNYSAYGNWVDVAAPGGETSSTGCRYPPTIAILSTMTGGSVWNQHGTACGITNSEVRYMGLVGTSMASPHAAGVAGLVFANSPQITVGMVVGQVKYGADSLDIRNPLYAGKLGTGRLNAYQSLTTTAVPKLQYSAIAMNSSTEQWPNGLLEPGESGSLLVTIHNDWASAYSVNTQLSSTSPYMVITQAQAQYGTILSGEYKNNSVPFAVTLSSNTPAGEVIPLRLALSYTNSAGNSFNVTIDFSYTVTTDIGWPKKNMSVNSMLFADLNLDGNNEVVFAGMNASNYTSFIGAYTFDGHLLWLFTLPNTGFLDSFHQIAIGDIDNDRYPEIVFGTQRLGASNPASLYVLTHTGTAKSGWPKTEQILRFDTPLLTDVNNDSVLDVVVSTRATTDNPQIRVYTGAGTLLWTRVGMYQEVASTVVGDLNHDGTSELVTAFRYQQVPWNSTIVTTKQDGTNFGPAITVLDEKITHAPTLADIDNNGDLEILFSTTVRVPDSEKLYIYHHDGTPLTGWPKVLHPSTRLYGRGPAVADIDNDGDLEIFADGGMASNYFGWHHTGVALANWPIAAARGSAIPPVIGDVDGDSVKDIVFVTQDCTLVAYHQNATIVAGYPKQLTTETCSPSGLIIGTLGNLNKVDIGVTSLVNDGAFIFNTNAVFNAMTMEWPMYLHDAQRTGAYVKLVQPSNTPTPTPTPTRTPTPTPVAGQVISQKISQASNDHYQLNSSSGLPPDATAVYIGKNGTINYYGAFRFPSMNLPSNVTIKSAKLRVAPRFYIADSGGSKAGTIKIFGEKSISSQPLTQGILASRSLTTAVVTWQVMSANEGWGSTTYKDTADISSIIRELVSQPGWTPASPVSLIFKDSSGPYWPLNAFENNQNYAAELVIETGSGGVVSPTITPSVPTPTMSPQQTSTLLGWVFIDTNGDGVRNAGETTGISAIQIQISGNGITRTAFSVSPSGYYEITNLPSLSGYTVTQLSQPSGYTSTSSNTITNVTIPTSPSYRTVNFGERR